MPKLKLILFALLINYSLFANTQNSFEIDSKKNVKSLLTKNYENLLISKVNLENYYYTNDFKPYWINVKFVDYQHFISFGKSRLTFFYAGVS